MHSNSFLFNMFAIPLSDLVETLIISTITQLADKFAAQFAAQIAAFDRMLEILKNRESRTNRATQYTR